MSSKSDYTSPLCSLAEENTNTNHFKLCIVLYLFIRRNYIELTSWELIWWEVDLVGVDLVGVGLVGVDLVGVDLVGGHLSSNHLVQILYLFVHPPCFLEYYLRTLVNSYS